ncbi:MAG: class I tRNA ligase family protein, partial [Candidatus Bathyarchaeia archaeon]
WRSENIKDLRAKLESFYRLAENITQEAKDPKTGLLEKWLLSRLQNRIGIVTEALENMKTRTAIENALYETWNDFRWYTRRKGNTHSKALKEAINIWTRLLAPFAPHICEEIWSKIGEKEFVSISPWPKPDAKKIDIEAEESETLVQNVLEDTQNILNATKITPKTIYYYVADKWKWKVYAKALEASAEKSVVMADLMKELMKDEELKTNAKQVAKFAPHVIDEINRTPNDKKQRRLKLKQLDEKKILTEAGEFFKREFAAKIQIFNESDAERYDPKKRAEQARPYRPAIYIE